MKLGRNRFECTPCSSLLKHAPSSSSSASLSSSSSSSSSNRVSLVERASISSTATTGKQITPTTSPESTTEFVWPTPGRRELVAEEYPPWRSEAREAIVWQEWSPCSVSCGAGWRSRARVCDGCDLNDYENVRVQPCMDNFYCPVDGNWGPWRPWGSCSTTCSVGTRTRTRKCNYPPPAFGGAYCPGEGVAQKECHLNNCPVDGGWGAWSELSACSKTCGQGRAIRMRQCDSPLPSHGGKDCPGLSEARQRCEVVKCPVNGAWSTWSVWGECSVTCGTGVREKVRSCDNPRPRHGGQDCHGEARVLKECYAGRPCPVDGSWSEWSAYSKCRARRCAKGFQVRTRRCTSPRPSNGGRKCRGKQYERAECFNDVNCPQNGNWCPWSQWNSCSSSCAQKTSVRGRQRHCACPPSKGGGLECDGESLEIEECQDLPKCHTPANDVHSGRKVLDKKTPDLAPAALTTTASRAPAKSSLVTQKVTNTAYSTQRPAVAVNTSGPPSGQGADGGARTCDIRVPADLRVKSLSTVPPTPHGATNMFGSSLISLVRKYTKPAAASILSRGRGCPMCIHLQPGRLNILVGSCSNTHCPRRPRL
ncbi:hemicentin-1 [Plakobranchus ocellatus]|uniref:Hemicentin-1 n=1 Tax=Plakobranchus ocellatus TaxID=259542 RepID=A0AAV3Z0C0_9GAST|nr:hemicentin-1 [Plakobranchus ocellatus]